MATEMDTDRQVRFEITPGTNGEGGPGPLSPSSVGGMKKKSSLKLTSSKKREGPAVSFVETVTVRQLPAEEAEAAQDTRRGPWEAAPEHDELWDGDNKDFWEQEKTLEEVHRIVVIRQMRMALEYNLGYAFYAMVANFKKRRPLAEPDPTRPQRSNSEDVVPQFETPGAEETAIRKEIRELFADSVKGLDFPDLIKDREAFEKIYQSTVLNISDMKRNPGLGLNRVEELVDEIVNTEEMCELLGVKFIAAPIQAAQPSTSAKEKIDSEVGKEEKRRNERRASVEASNNGVSVFAARRASVDSKQRGSTEPTTSSPVSADKATGAEEEDEDQPIFASAGRSGVHVRPTTSAAPVVAAAETPQETKRRPSTDTRRPSLTEAAPTDARRPSLVSTPDGPARRSSITPPGDSYKEARRSSLSQTPTPEQRRSSVTLAANPLDQRRSSLTSAEPRRSSITQPPPVLVSESAVSTTTEATSPTESKSSLVGHVLTLLLGFVLLMLSAMFRGVFGSPESAPGAEEGPAKKGSGALGWVIPLLAMFLVAVTWR